MTSCIILLFYFPCAFILVTGERARPAATSGIFLVCLFSYPQAQILFKVTLRCGEVKRTACTTASGFSSALQPCVQCIKTVVVKPCV